MKRYLYHFTGNHPRYCVFTRRYLLLWLTAILFDIHRYGCWINGNQAYWKPKSYLLVPLSMLPFLPWVLSKWVQYAEDNGRQYLYKFVLLWIPWIIAGVAFMFDGRIFEPDWLDRSLLMGHIRTDTTGIVALYLVVQTSFCVWLGLRNGIRFFK